MEFSSLEADANTYCPGFGFPLCTSDSKNFDCWHMNLGRKTKGPTMTGKKHLQNNRSKVTVSVVRKGENTETWKHESGGFFKTCFGGIIGAFLMFFDSIVDPRRQAKVGSMMDCGIHSMFSTKPQLTFPWVNRFIEWVAQAQSSNPLRFQWLSSWTMSTKSKNCHRLEAQVVVVMFFFHVQFVDKSFWFW